MCHTKKQEISCPTSSPVFPPSGSRPQSMAIDFPTLLSPLWTILLLPNRKLLSPLQFGIYKGKPRNGVVLLDFTALFCRNNFSQITLKFSSQFPRIYSHYLQIAAKSVTFIQIREFCRMPHTRFDPYLACKRYADSSEKIKT